MKIIYGKRKIRGKILFDVEHKFARGIHLDDQAVMIIRRILKTYPDAGNFEWLSNTQTGCLCAGLFKEKGE